MHVLYYANKLLVCVRFSFQKPRRALSEKEINLMKENVIPRNIKHATKFGMTHFKGKKKIVLNVTMKPFKFP